MPGIIVFRALFRDLAPPVLLSILALAALSVSFLLFHTLAELFSIVIAVTAMVVATTSRDFTRNHFLVYLAVASGWCAAIDFAHLVAYKGMGLLPGGGANMSTQLWVAARMLQALALVTSPWFIRHQIGLARLHTVLGLLAVGAVFVVLSGRAPDTFIEGQGLTPFKVNAEYVIIGLLVLTLPLLWLNCRMLSLRLCATMTAVVVLMIVSELAFSQYANAFDWANVSGHILKIFAYWFVYVALVQTTLREPFRALSGAASTYDAVPEPTLLVRADGNILQANRAAAAAAGRPAADLVGSSTHVLFHDASVPGESCAACLAIANGGDPHLTEIAGPRGTTLECSATPFLAGRSQALVAVIRDVTDRKRLASLYDTLSAINRAIVQVRDTGQLLEAALAALVAHGAFPVVLVGRRQRGSETLRIELAHGLDAGDIEQINSFMRDPARRIDALGELAMGRVVLGPMPGEAMPGSLGWTRLLAAVGVTDRALLPIMEHDRLEAFIGVFASGHHQFNTEQMNLLTTMAADRSYAVTSLSAESRRHAAEQRANLSEHRFRKVFEASPMPMQLLSVSTGELVALNRALFAWLGYSEDELASTADWFEKVYRAPALRDTLASRWASDVEAARETGSAVTSPEIELSCKDGSRRIAQGSMTVVDDDVVVTWVDLTEIRRTEQNIRENEQRLRALVEQSMVGIYASISGIIGYANPRFCEIIGKPASELVGRDILDVIDADAAARELVRGQRVSIAMGGPGRQFSVPVRRADGTTMELGLQGSLSTWDGKPAFIVMAQDITERKLAEGKIAAYVRQLEGSMRGTLKTISNMVDLRDPYTAGHERRVGLVAQAIGRELGWPADRCDSLEMIGLVHDVGKIAVPTEILSRPGRLSPIEMEIVRGHVEAGYDILKDAEFVAPVAEVVRQHHERLDGSGYPRGLRGGEMLPEARVLAVADVFESMASHRPYRPSLGTAAALAELEEGRGRLYDPDAVDALRRLIDEKGYTLPT